MSAKRAAIFVVTVLALAGCGGSSNSSSTATTSGGAATTSGGSATTSGGGGAAANGAQLFSSNGCSGCHTLKAAGSTGTTGPNLDTQLPTDAKAAGKDLKAFAKESIVNPSAYIAKGYSDHIMPSNFGSSLKPDEINALVDYVTGGK